MLTRIMSVLLFLGIIVFMVLLSALFVKVGWSLFMVPVFEMRELSWIEAIGFGLLTASFRDKQLSKKNPRNYNETF